MDHYSLHRIKNDGFCEESSDEAIWVCHSALDAESSDFKYTGLRVKPAMTDEGGLSLRGMK